MHKTFAAIQRHVDADAAYLPLRPEVVGYWEDLPALSLADDAQPAIADGGTVPRRDAIDKTVRDADPDVVVANSRFPATEYAFPGEYPFVHVRHGSSVGRGEVENTTSDLAGVVDVALAPGEYWARRYRERFAEDVHTPVVGIPEADGLVDGEPPRERRILYAPTNHNYGGGSYLRTAEHVLDVVADSPFDLRFRPHPHDRTEEPGRSLTDRCKTRISDMPNASFDDADNPTESMLDTDLLVSDFSGIVTEWLHTGRPLVQLTDVAADADVPQLGYTTDRLSVDLLETLYEDGYPDDVETTVEAKLEELGIPMDGHAGERAAQEVMACTQ